MAANANMYQLVLSDGQVLAVPATSLFPPAESPNYVQSENAAQIGPSDPVTFAAPAITRRGSATTGSATTLTVPIGGSDFQVFELEA